MLDMVQLFRENDTRDELGVGTVRDAFSDCFFPGTSTIQTRARYMLFVPWTYRGLERREISSADIAARARKEETKLITALLESGDTDGVIGKDARAGLQRLPSSVYWSALESWGIRQVHLSQDQYHRSLDAHYRRKRQVLVSEDRESVIDREPENWDPALPEPPEGWPQKATLALTRSEATYLRERIFCQHGGSVLSHLIDMESFVPADFLWEHPVVGSLPTSLQKTVMHARNFSETIHGAALCYNLMLSQRRGNPDWVGQYERALAVWTGKMLAHWEELTHWHDRLDHFWSSEPLATARVPSATVSFVNAWLAILLRDKGRVSAIAADTGLQSLLADREFRLKGSRSRLNGGRHLDMWSGVSGGQQLGFRWQVAQRMCADIISGLKGEDSTDA